MHTVSDTFDIYSQLLLLNLSDPSHTAFTLLQMVQEHPGYQATELLNT